MNTRAGSMCYASTIVPFTVVPLWGESAASGLRRWVCRSRLAAAQPERLLQRYVVAYELRRHLRRQSEFCERCAPQRRPCRCPQPRSSHPVSPEASRRPPAHAYVIDALMRALSELLSGIIERA